MTADITLAPCPTELAALLHDLDVIACTTLHATIEGSRKSYERDAVRKAIEVIRAQAAPQGPALAPLTDEQIATIASTPCAVVGSYVHTFARAIEAAHGITGAPNGKPT